MYSLFALLTALYNSSFSAVCPLRDLVPLKPIHPNDFKFGTHYLFTEKKSSCNLISKMKKKQDVNKAHPTVNLLFVYNSESQSSLICAHVTSTKILESILWCIILWMHYVHDPTYVMANSHGAWTVQKQAVHTTSVLKTWNSIL